MDRAHIRGSAAKKDGQETGIMGAAAARLAWCTMSVRMSRKYMSGARKKKAGVDIN